MMNIDLGGEMGTIAVICGPLPPQCLVCCSIVQ